MEENKKMKSKKKKKSFIIMLCALLACVCAVVCLVTLTDKNNDIKISTEKTEKDSGIDWSKYKTYDIKLDGNEVTIDKAGVYNISGTSTKQIKVNTEDNVKLVLTDVKLETSNAPGINVENAKNIYIELKGSNEINANTTDDADAAIYSKDNLVLLGDGSIKIKSNKDGIASKDDLTILSGTYEIESEGDAIKGKDSVTIEDGKFTLTTNDDGIKASNSEDTEKGWIRIENGEFDITATSNDGIQAITMLTINNGTFKINAKEGLEATYIMINNGTFEIKASDDGINASAKSTVKTPTIEINGGEVTIETGQGDTDAIDSNGNLYINGGKITITAQSPFDYDGEGELKGGEVYVNGEKVSELTNQMMGGPGGGMPGRNGEQPGQKPMNDNANADKSVNGAPEGQGTRPEKGPREGGRQVSR